MQMLARFPLRSAPALLAAALLALAAPRAAVAQGRVLYENDFSGRDSAALAGIKVVAGSFEVVTREGRHYLRSTSEQATFDILLANRLPPHFTLQADLLVGSRDAGEHRFEFGPQKSAGGSYIRTPHLVLYVYGEGLNVKVGGEGVSVVDTLAKGVDTSEVVRASIEVNGDRVRAHLANLSDTPRLALDAPSAPMGRSRAVRVTLPCSDREPCLIGGIRVTEGAAQLVADAPTPPSSVTPAGTTQPASRTQPQELSSSAASGPAREPEHKWIGRVTYGKTQIPDPDVGLEVWGMYGILPRFDDRRAELPAVDEDLDQIGHMLTQRPRWDVTLVVHTMDYFTRNPAADATKNLELSIQRGRAIRAYLTRKFKLDSTRVRVYALGDARPMHPDPSKPGEFMSNRHVDVSKGEPPRGAMLVPADPVSVGTMPPTAQPTAPASDPNSGKFRVLVTGFVVHGATRDDPLELDGKGDEVYVSAMSRDTYGSPPVDRYVASKTYGDVNSQHGRVQAGSASSKGGLRAGDHVPADPTSAAGSVSDFELPLLAWQGTLVRGKTTVIIAPILWESDNKPKHARDLYSQPLNWLLPDSIIHAPRQGVSTLRVAGSRSRSLDQTVESKADRPLGTTLWFGGMLRDKESLSSYGLQFIALDLETAERLASLDGGIVKLRYRDGTADFDSYKDRVTGDYTLYLRVERAK